MANYQYCKTTSRGPGRCESVMFIEDLIDRLSSNGNYLFHPSLSISYIDTNLVVSLSAQINQGSAYTEKQRGLALRIVTKYQTQLSTDLAVDVAAIVKNPQYKHGLRVLSGIRAINIVNREAVPTIAVQFPYHAELVENIKAYKDTRMSSVFDSINWNSIEKCWDFALTESNIQFLESYIEQGFVADNLFLQYIDDIRSIKQNIDKYVPIVEYVDGNFKYSNIVDRIPQPTSTNLVEVLLHAKRHGITCWDETIAEALESVNPTTHRFLKAPTSSTDKSQETTLDQIRDILRYSETVLFVIPGGTEIEHLQHIHEYLKSIDYQEEQMTVMFRLDSSSGKICNDYIKQHKLNTPLNDSVKFVFVSGKIPKPLIAANKNFEVVVHFGTNSAHYTLQIFVRNHHSVISMNLPNRK